MRVWNVMNAHIYTFIYTHMYTFIYEKIKFEI